MPELKCDPGLWLRHNLKVSLRRNKLLRSVLSPLRGSLDQPQASGAAQLDLAGRTPRAPLRLIEGTAQRRQTGGDFFWLLFLARQEK